MKIGIYMRLINGRGQLGTELTKWIKNSPNVDIYHTWNFLDKSKDTQLSELKKFKSYLNSVKSSRKVIFISTSVEIKSYYLKCKRLAENLLKESRNENLIIRLPSLIGKGVFTKLFKNEADPYGTIEFTTTELASRYIVNNINVTGLLTMSGWTCKAEAVYEIMQFCNKSIFKQKE